MKRVAVLGSTGSIGVQALDVIRGSDRLTVHSLLCRSNVGLIASQSEEFDSALACVTDPPPGSDTRGMVTGAGALEAAVDGADMVLNAIVGSQGLRASLMAMDRDIPLALANKESLVVGGELLRDFLAAGSVVPVDSEHSTVYRCLMGEESPAGRIVLTASGGPLRTIPLDGIENASPADVLAHPTWEMGSRITVDSATMANKGFEVIEAGWLFPGIPVSVLVHPQSVVHSLVRLGDGSWKALLGSPDMRVPIQFALLHPDGGTSRISDDSPLDWGELTFEPLDGRRYPAFTAVMAAGQDGGTAPAVANAADEVAVQAFLEERIQFGGIARVIESVLSAHRRSEVTCLDDVLRADEWARREAAGMTGGKC
jgi:1-deoxy-D-xylulose-5-phosphate reductoisomerase